MKLREHIDRGTYIPCSFPPLDAFERKYIASIDLWKEYKELLLPLTCICMFYFLLRLFPPRFIYLCAVSSWSPSFTVRVICICSTDRLHDPPSGEYVLNQMPHFLYNIRGLNDWICCSVLYHSARVSWANAYGGLLVCILVHSPRLASNMRFPSPCWVCPCRFVKFPPLGDG